MNNLWLEGEDIQQKRRGKISKEARVKARVTQGGSADCQQGFLDISKKAKNSPVESDRTGETRHSPMV